MKSWIISAVFLVSFSVLFTPFSRANAQLMPFMPFGGLVLSTIPCTCPSSAGNLLIIMAPLYAGFGLPFYGSVVYVPYMSQVFAWFQIGVPGTWHLGTYIPGAGSAQCLMVNPVALTPPCVPIVPPLPVPVGTIFQVGTSSLGD